MNPDELLTLTYGCTLNLVLFAIYYIYLSQKNTRRWWVHPINRKRDHAGFYTNLFQEMKYTDHERFFEFTRMWPHQFDKLLQLVSPQLVKNSIRKPLTPELQLAMTLSYLAQGDSVNSKAWEFRVGKSTARKVIHKVCQVIWSVLQPIYLPAMSQQRFMKIAHDFQTKWQFPHCLGALDGCHIPIRCPPNSGSSFFCFKKYFSINLMAICDAHYKFTWVDVGQYGSISDAGVWSNTILSQYLEGGQLQLPPVQPLPGSPELLPHFFIADEGFPLKKFIMLPYSRRQLGIKERVFNYRLSRARRIIENSFGILKARWQIIRRGLNCNAENATNMVNALVCLHNFVMTEEENLPTRYKKYSVLNDEPLVNDIQHLRFREEEIEAEERRTAQEQRDLLRDYFVSGTGANQAPWQWQSALGAFNINLPNPL